MLLHFNVLDERVDYLETKIDTSRDEVEICSRVEYGAI